MNWYLQSGRDSDVVISTKVRYARNLRNYRFGINTEEELKRLEEEIKMKLPKLGYGVRFFKLRDLDNITIMSLQEKNLINADCAKNKNAACDILINDDENICVMVNEREHIKLQVFSSGFELEETFNLASEIDKRIEDIFDIAKSRKYGYITHNLRDLGTGMRVSVLLHLPVLNKTGNIIKVLENVNSFCINIIGAYEENSKISGDIYHISNKQTLGITEEEIIKNLKIIIEKVIEQERTARRILAKNQINIEDIVYRSYGILSNCKKISLEETRSLLSDIKLGTDLGIIKELTDQKILEMFLYSKPANLQKRVGRNLDAFDQDIKRAEIIKQIIERN